MTFGKLQFCKPRNLENLTVDEIGNECYRFMKILELLQFGCKVISMGSVNRKFQQRRLDAARGYLVLGMPEQALRELQAITHPARCAFDYHLLTAEARRERLEHGHAIRAFIKALDERPDNLQALLGLAWCYKRQSHLDLAIETLELARTAHPDEPLVIYNLSCYFSLAGNKPKAIECLGRALRMEPAFSRLISEERDFDALREDPDFQFVAHSVVDSE